MGFIDSLGPLGPLGATYSQQFGSFRSSETTKPSIQWEFQDPKLEVPTIYKAYIRPM